jgi:hypothetical protein
MLDDHKVKKMPPAPRLIKILGPSFILLGLGLGSGEIILWPYLTSNFGMGIIWGAVLGITLQFFINMEIERYSLVKGESIFVGFARKFKNLPYWFILSTFFAWIWPGIIAASAKLLGALVGVEDTRLIAILLLVLIGVILTLGPILYKTVEKIATILIVFGVPGIFILTLFLADKTDWIALANGLIGKGEGYFLLPASIPIASFLAAFAFSGAGGNLNLAQSFYIKEKGYGMGKYSGRITSLLTGEVEDITLEGTRFEMDQGNLAKFKSWWKLVNIEHLLVFWATGAFTICLLGLLAFATAHGATTPAAGINFVLFEAAAIAQKTLPIFGTLFLLIGGVMLFSTQMTVLDATSRIMSENLLILKRRSWAAKSLPKIYYCFLWAQIVFGVVIFLVGFGEPLLLLTLAAVINAGAMFVHIALTLILNLTRLERQVRPSLVRILVMVFSLAFFGYFTLRSIFSL